LEACRTVVFFSQWERDRDRLPGEGNEGYLGNVGRAQDFLGAAGRLFDIGGYEYALAVSLSAAPKKSDSAITERICSCFILLLG